MGGYIHDEVNKLNLDSLMLKKNAQTTRSRTESETVDPIPIVMMYGYRLGAKSFFKSSTDRIVRNRIPVRRSEWDLAEVDARGYKEEKNVAASKTRIRLSRWPPNLHQTDCDV